MTRRAFVVAGLALAIAAPSAKAQLKGVRFEIAVVGDTTLGFRTGTERWIRPGERGIAVDPRRRDVLVARLRVLRVDSTGTATALITGQTTALSTDHVVIVQEPRRRWYQSKSFWGGLVAGLAFGVVAGKQI